jgi:hypothetical protein
MEGWLRLFRRRAVLGLIQVLWLSPTVAECTLLERELRLSFRL